MDFLYERLFRRAFFQLESERAHEVGVKAMSLLGRLQPVCRVLERANQLDAAMYRPVQLFGLTFPNRIGLAAGFDKNAVAWPAAAAMGFGHVEVGTVTALAQPGNEKPRVFRFPQEEAIINRMGFNNAGAAAMAARLSGQPGVGRRRIPLGVNLGKSKAALLDRATEDYLQSYAQLAPFADYLVLNVSSPNTPDLRKLQDEERLRHLLSAITSANRARAAGQGGRHLPVLLKIAPDLNWAQVDRVLAAIGEFGLDGVIATNTTLARPGPFAAVNEAGGLSGAPLRRRSTEIIRYMARATSFRLPIIGVGGIMDETSAAEKMDAGASLLQLYTGLIYRGPWFPAQLARAVGDRDRGGNEGLKKTKG